MKIELKASTANIRNKSDAIAHAADFNDMRNTIESKEEAKDFARAAARVCYSKHGFDRLLAEDNADLIARILKSAHQSPFDHINLTFYIEDLPKLFAMVLNNERPYTTSEKSARYTKMQITPREQVVFDKWMSIFRDEISKQYPNIPSDKLEKLAQENARYATSVFTPTKMLHTLSFRQVNYLLHWFDDFIETGKDTPFYNRLKQEMGDFCSQLKEAWYLEQLAPDLKRRKLSFFGQRNNYAEEFGETYSTTYPISFACLAQAHRHRTLDYEIVDFDENRQLYFVPAIIRQNGSLVDEWNSDLASVSDIYPQGTLIDVHEKGYYIDLVSKLNERLCGNAQFEIMEATKSILIKYLERTKKSNPDVHAELSQYAKGPRCTFPGAKCVEPCVFGQKKGLERLI